MVTGSTSRTLDRELIGGTEGRHDEQWLQRLIHQHPTCLPMDQIEPGLPALVPVCMELPLSSGYLDNLLMTPEGDIVIVEVKLFRNPQARREVIAQALDYASSLFGMTYTDLEEAVLQSDFGRTDKPTRLYGIFPEANTLDEAAFVDAVNTNLKTGRIVVLVAGDGIRTDAEDLVNGLQSHAGFHFTFALVELAVFQGAVSDDLMVVPRTLAKTCMIERGIVRIDDQRSEVVSAPTESTAIGAATPQSISSEQFFEAMRELSPDLPATLQGFIAKCAAIGVYPEFRRSLNFKWDAPTGRTVNLGYVLRNGPLWTDATNTDDPLMAQMYLDDLAARFGGSVVRRDSGNMYVVVDGKAPSIENLTDHLDGWITAIEKLQDRIREGMTKGRQDG